MMEPTILNTITHWIQNLIQELHAKDTLIKQQELIIKEQQELILSLQSDVSIRLDEMRIINEILRKQSQIKLNKKSKVGLTDLLQQAPQRV
jgi:hypothetical protein